MEKLTRTCKEDGNVCEVVTSHLPPLPPFPTHPVIEGCGDI